MMGRRTERGLAAERGRSVGRFYEVIDQSDHVVPWGMVSDRRVARGHCRDDLGGVLIRSEHVLCLPSSAAKSSSSPAVLASQIDDGSVVTTPAWSVDERRVIEASAAAALDPTFFKFCHEESPPAAD